VNLSATHIQTFLISLNFLQMGRIPFTLATLRNVFLKGKGTVFHFGTWNPFDTTQAVRRCIFAKEPLALSVVTSCIVICSGRSGTAAVFSWSIFGFLFDNFYSIIGPYLSSPAP
jgi:hypothetical protein